MKRFFNFTKVQPIPAGVYHRQAAPPDQPPYRIHLRLQPDGSGILVVNAATVMHLNPTAAEYAYHFIKRTDAAAVARAVASRYRVAKGTALKDFGQFAARVETLLTTPDLDPVAYLDFQRVSPYSTQLGAPLRLDCALTYRLPSGATTEYAPTKRVDRELNTAEWIQILEKAWQMGVPHVTFTGGEASLREDLVELIRHAEGLGQVCGLLTDGSRLAERTYLDQLLQSGLDHILLILQPDRADSWKALETILAEDVFVTVHLTVTNENAPQAVPHLEKLASLGCKSLSLSFADRGISAAILSNTAASLGLALKFDLPVPYSADNPVSRETAQDAVSDGAGRAWLYVEPDGDVLPAQGMAGNVLGNLLRDPWAKIYSG
ncbi:MAG: radical SAM protein [Chloroflexota bacterium]